MHIAHGNTWNRGQKNENLIFVKLFFISFEYGMEYAKNTIVKINQFKCSHKIHSFIRPISIY